VYNKDTTNIYDVFNVFNNIMPTMKFTTEEEKEKINFPDITISKEKDNLSFDINRKPTATDTIIPSDSCHPHEYKLAAVRYLANRRETYNLKAINKEKENNTIKQILCKNKYISILNKSTTMQNKVKQYTSKTKWAKFIYVSKGTKFITKLFKNTPLKIAFTTQNTIGKLLSKQQNHNQNKFDKCGVYQLTCPDCNKNYIGELGRLFHVRFQEHFRDYKYGNNKSKLAQNLIDNKHSISPTENIMDIIHTTIKGKMLNTMEKYYIYKETRINIQINDKCTVKPDVVFETLILEDTDTAHITL
jgi:hypothetical protein